MRLLQLTDYHLFQLPQDKQISFIFRLHSYLDITRHPFKRYWKLRAKSGAGDSVFKFYYRQSCGNAGYKPLLCELIASWGSDHFVYINVTTHVSYCSMRFLLFFFFLYAIVFKWFYIHHLL